MQILPCFLCGHKLEKRTTKRGKPYFVCDRCGIQLFIRGKQGIERLEEFFRNAGKAEVPYKQHAQNFHEMQAFLKEIDDVQQEIKKIGISYFFDDDKLRIRNTLKTRQETLFFQLEQFAERKENKHMREDKGNR
jgi:DNA-directed RNA polymerase subunit RPC12/RpoP